MESTTKTKGTDAGFTALEIKLYRQLEYYRDGWAHAQYSRAEMAAKMFETCDRIEAAAGTLFLLNARAKSCRDRVNDTLASETQTILTEVLTVFGKCAVEDEETTI